MPYNSLKNNRRPDRERKKQFDIGGGPIKACILGIISYHTPRGGCSVSKILVDLAPLRSESQTRVQDLLDDLVYRELIKLTDMSHYRKNLTGYIITEKGNKFLNNYFSIEYREIQDVSQSLSEVNYADIKDFWENLGQEY